MCFNKNKLRIILAERTYIKILLPICFIKNKLRYIFLFKEVIKLKVFLLETKIKTKFSGPAKY